MNLHVKQTKAPSEVRNALPFAGKINGVIMPMGMERDEFTLFAQALDLTATKFKLIKESGWTLERADLVEPQYKAFLFLLGTDAKRSFVPTFDIDEMWHTHILDTRKYMADCARHFGKYIHHYPYMGLKGEADAARARELFNATRTAISDTLGGDLPSAKFSDCGGGCSGGSSCSSSCSGGGHSSCSGGGHGHGGHDSGYGQTDNTPAYTPVITPSCSTYGGDTSSPSRDTPSKPGKTPDRPKKPEKKKGIIRSILGLSPADKEAAWYASVTPELFGQEYRPGATALAGLADSKPSIH